MNKKKKIQALFVLLIVSNLFFIFFVDQSKLKNDPITLNEENHEKDIPQISHMDNESNVIVFFNKSSYDKSATLNFTYHGGNIKEEWNDTFTSISGFTGIIPTINISLYQNNITEAMIETNEIIETQMNYATIQTEAVNSTWYLNGYNGNTNSSIAILDTGVEANHLFFPDGFESTNLNGNIVGQENLINGGLAFDDHGHGTFITSIISGTGTEPYNSSSPTNINLYGNYSHLELFDSLSPKNYSVKIFTFNVSKINSHIFINSSWNLQVSGIDGFWFELYNRTTLVNNSLNMTVNKYYSINHSISKSGQGIYDLYVKYHKKTQKKPIFSFNTSISFYPEFYVNNYTYYTGIANATKIVAYKILNQTGIGYTSDLISALASVIQNKSKYHIISVCLSIGTLGEDVVAINAVINEVINNGTLVVIAAGNSGIEGSDPLNKLALNKNAIVVGAINDDDQVTSYSSMGKNVGKGVIKPDIVAPGGSKLPGHRLIIGADIVSNKTTAAYGTSIASAIVSAAINILIEAKCGNWTEWNKLNLTNWVKTIKSILLMTASETNLNREDDPNTDVDESDYSPDRFSPLLGVGLTDVHEGYGRLNIQGAIDALTKIMRANTTINGTLVSSRTNPLGTHVFARRINLTPNKQYIFNLTDVDNSANFDLYLFSNESDSHGEPFLLQSSRKLNGDFNYFYFIPKENETESIIVIKAIEGNSTFKLNVSIVINEFAPILNITEVPYIGGAKNTTVMSYQEFLGEAPEKNYTIDRYLFFIQYSDNDTSNAPPQDIYVSIVETGRNYTLSVFNPFANVNYTEGVLYWSEQVQFEAEDNYSYFFVASDGPHGARYPKTGVLNITIVFPTDSKQFPYNHSFSDGLGDWYYTGTGWGELTQINSNDDRSRLYNDEWKSLYFGIDHSNPTNYTYQPVMITDPYPNGSLTSPLINITQLSENSRPFAKFGLRTSINSNDYVYLRMNLNYSGWTTIKTYTNEEREWFLEEINMTQYIGNYVQFRFVTSIDETFDPINYKGFMLDYFAIENKTNNNPPEIVFNPNLDVTPLKDSKYEKFTFSIEYYDSDNNYPDFVYLEMDGKNYTMLNIYGDWNANSNALEDKGIFFSKTLIINDMANRSFMFYVSDGKNRISSQWYNKDNSLISFIEPKPLEFNVRESNKKIGYEFSNDALNDYYIAGTPIPKEITTWFIGDNTWHLMTRLEKEYLYGGIGQSYGGINPGYDQNWDAKLITKPLQLKSEYDVYLEFDYEISLENEYGYNEDLLDKCVVSISNNYGDSWVELKDYNYNSEDLSGSEKFDISKYSEDIVMIMFNLHTNDYTIGLGYGWLLSNIYIGYDKSIDFIAPEIEISNPKNGTIVNSLIMIEANITDDVKLDLEKIQIYIENEIVDKEKVLFNNDTGVLSFEWDTTLISDGIYEIKIVAYDKEGNRAEKTISVNVDNYLINWEKWAPWIILIIGSIIAGFLMYILAEKRGQIWFEKIRNYRAEKVRINGIDKEQVIKRIELLEPEEELNLPLTLYCKFCKSWFSSDNYGMMCPVCDHDQIYVAYNCMNCNKWFFKDEPGQGYYCKKCEGIRLIRRAKEDIQDILAQEGKILRKFERKQKKFTIFDL